MVSSSNRVRGWWGFGLMLEMGTSRSALPAPAETSVGISAPRPLPSPLRRAIAHLLCKLSIGDRPARGGVEDGDGLPERRRLRQADRAGDHDAAHLLAEVLADLGGHVGRVPRARVVHG